jgi:hypothetical protein
MYIPLNGPVHSVISDENWWQPEEDLVLCATEGVEDSVVCGTSERILTVGREAVGSDTLLWWRAYCSVSRVMLAGGGFGWYGGFVEEGRKIDG